MEPDQSGIDVAGTVIGDEQEINDSQKSGDAAFLTPQDVVKDSGDGGVIATDDPTKSVASERLTTCQSPISDEMRANSPQRD